MTQPQINLKPASIARGTITPPGSKSIANRVLPICAMGRGPVVIRNIPSGDDVNLMATALVLLGSDLRREGCDIRLTGRGAPFSREGEIRLALGNSGTASRFLTALLSTGSGQYIIDGAPRLHERPVGHLVNALTGLCPAAETESGTRFRWLNQTGFPPLEISARGLEGGRTSIRGNVSSQFLSGLLMALPFCRNAAQAEVEGLLVSSPYIELTLEILNAFQAGVQHEGLHAFSCPHPAGLHNPETYMVEPDASSASYFLAAGALGGGEVTVEGIGSESLQFRGEGGFARVLEQMGARIRIEKNRITASGGRLRGIDIDMDKMSDTAMTLAVTALFAEGPTRIRNIGNWRVKETDRLAAMAAELRKLGAGVEEGESDLLIHPPAEWKPAEIDTYDDHRMAMSFSLACFSPVQVAIANPGCVSKTYPDFFQDFASVVSGAS